MNLLFRLPIPLLLLVCVATFGTADPDAQNAWYPNSNRSPNYPANGQVKPLATTSNGQPSGIQCGNCPAGYQREVVQSNFQLCGRCVLVDKSCAQGNVLIGNQCQQCPCPGTGERKFGTSCRVDSDGQITCDCSPEYTGRDCGQCAPGTVQSNQYPYNCLRYNNTNSQSSFCPPGNICRPQTVNQAVARPQIQPPVTSCSTGCGYQNGCGVLQPQIQPIRPNPYPQPQPQPQPGNGGCGVGKCPSACATNGCQAPCGSNGQNGCSVQQPQIQPIRPNPYPQPQPIPGNGGCGVGNCPSACATNGCQVPCGSNGQNGCSVQQPQIQPIRPNPWPQPQPIPNPPCPVPLPGPGPILCPNPTPPVQCYTNGNGQIQCPGIQYPSNGNGNGGSVQCPAVQCPVIPPPAPCPAIQCPVIPPQIQCPPLQCPPIQGPCPACPVVPPVICPPVQDNCGSPVSCPSPCPTLPVIPACPQCPTPSCPQCPMIPACPQCPQICPQCPAPLPCNNCPSPCAPCPPAGECSNCPNPCQRCPEQRPCPDCQLTCNCPNTTCPAIPGQPELIQQISPCICDPRGTVNQYESNCYCKSNVEGYRCDSCKPGYFALSTDRREGCLQCWGSGVSTYCSAATYYRTYLRTSRAADCSIELTDEKNTVVYNKDSPKFNWDGNEARLTLSVSTKLYWSLPSCLKGNRLTSYGASLKLSRMFTGGGTPFGPDNDIMIVGGNGAMLIYSSFATQSSGDWKELDVVLDETEHWVVWRPGGSEGGSSWVAGRFDILEVLADVQMILIRATFTTNTLSASIRNVALGSVSKSATSEGLVLIIEQARCPVGYQGLSCESCSPGYFRDTTDMSASVFGACKFCPCGRNAAGCHISYGAVACKCKIGFTGDRCQDKEVITVTLDPFWIRDYEGTETDFTCTVTTNSKRTLLMRLSSEDQSNSVEARTLTNTYKLSKLLGRIKCEIVDTSNVVWAIVYAAIQIEMSDLIVVPPPRGISLVMKDEFICVNETDRVEFSVTVGHYGSRKMIPEWRKEGNREVLRTGDTFVIPQARLSDSGTYMASATDGESIGVARLVLLVRKYPSPPNYRMLGDDPTPFLSLPGPISNQTLPTNNSKNGNTSSKVISSGPPTLQKPSLLNSMQKDQAILEGYPMVVVSPEEVRAKVGESVTLRCNVSGEEPMKFYWKSGSNDYIPVHVRVSRGALIFKSVIKEDQGSYYCVAWNNFGQVTGRANLYVEDKPVTQPPQIPLSITVSQTSLNATPGANIYFDCFVNDPTVKPVWSRKFGDLPLSSEVNENGTLILYRVSEIDAGSYICSAQRPSGQSVQIEATLSLAPLVPSAIPTLSLRPKSPLKVRSGEKVRIECTATGYPIPNTSWTRSIEGSDKKLVSSGVNVTAYEILHATKADEGKYTCTSISDAGQKSESLSLIVDDAIICKANEFRCKSGDQCVSKDDRCDNERDCNDGSDESHCRKRSRRSLKK